jgi:hypothetical protein
MGAQQAKLDTYIRTSSSLGTPFIKRHIPIIPSPLRMGIGWLVIGIVIGIGLCITFMQDRAQAIGSGWDHCMACTYVTIRSNLLVVSTV